MSVISALSIDELVQAELDNNFPFERAKKIKMIIFDVDGVLTDGGVYYDEEGKISKRFDVQDGQGIKMLIKSGIIAVIITGMLSKSVGKRAEVLGVDECHMGILDKYACLEKIMQKYQVSWEELAYVGDDVIDLAPLSKAGLALAVANAQPEVKKFVHYCSPLRGGRGAVRQMLRHILYAQGKAEESILYWLNQRLG